ncbi:hypothetical protein Tco_0854613 [Tanacetum coccineum]
MGWVEMGDDGDVYDRMGVNDEWTGLGWGLGLGYDECDGGVGLMMEKGDVVWSFGLMEGNNSHGVGNEDRDEIYDGYCGADGGGRFLVLDMVYWMRIGKTLMTGERCVSD